MRLPQFSIPLDWWDSLPLRDRRRIGLALAVSLWVHALIISLNLGAPGAGLPGIAVPWAERRVQAMDLEVRLEPVAPPLEAVPRVDSMRLRRADTLMTPTPRRSRERVARSAPQPPVLVQRAPRPKITRSAKPAPRVAQTLEQKRPDAPVVASAPSEEPAAKETEETARERALALQKEQETKRIEDARRADEARRLAEAKAQEEVQKQEQARRLAAEAEALRRDEAARRAEETARQEALARQKELETRRLAEEAATRARELAERQRMEAEARAKELAERQRAETEARARELADRQRAEADARARDLAARQRAEADARAKEAERQRAEAEAAAKRAAQARPFLPPGLALPPGIAETPRRRTIFGIERDVVVRMYVDGWRSKLERNGALNFPSARRPNRNPVVTVSIRSDGSLETVSISESSGVREFDEAALRIARLNAPYSAFPPSLARELDVIDIRREWFFDQTLRILDVSARN